MRSVSAASVASIAVAFAVGMVASHGVAQSAHEEADDETHDDAGGADDAAADDHACPAGLAAIDAAGHCCAPGQHWVSERCTGEPASCPPGFVLTAGERARCVARACEDQRERASDGIHCCWPGQSYEATRRRCRGETVHCPEGTTRLGDTDCAPPTRVANARPRRAAPNGTVWIPGGSFRMGASGQRFVTVGGFFVDRREVSNAAYARCVAARSCLPARNAFGASHADPETPVANVTWSMASSYCAWVGGRLPTESEWEFAARGIDGRSYPWGEARASCSVARMQGCGDDTLRVGSMRGGASPFGVLDLAGNVAEWTLDRWAPRLVNGSDRDPSGPDSGALRVVRGGSFVSDADAVRATARVGIDPDEARFDVGFRCVHTGR